jgi:hypothetical protein
VAVLMDSACRAHTQISGESSDIAPVVVDLLLPSTLQLEQATMAQAVAAAAGPNGSQQQQQLWSLLVSLVKYCRWMLQVPPSFAADCRVAVTYATQVLVLQALRGRQLAGSAGASSSAQGASSSAGSGSMQPGLGAGHSISSSGVVSAAMSVQDIAPWLALCGRCLLLWAQDLSIKLAVGSQLLSEVGDLSKSQQQQLVLSAQQQQGAAGASGQSADVPRDPKQRPERIDDATLLETVAVILQDGQSASGQGAAAGFDMLKPLAELQAATVLAKLPGVLQKLNPDVGKTGDLRLQQGLLVLKLQTACWQLNVLPFSWGCNSWACGNFSNGSESLIVKGKGRTCSACHVVRYCCKECQTGSSTRQPVGCWQPQAMPAKSSDRCSCARCVAGCLWVL